MQNLSPYWTGERGAAVPADSPEPGSARESVFFSAGAAFTDWRSFLEKYRRDLEALPLPASPVARYFEHLPPDKRRLWLTLLPAVASVRKIHGHEQVESSQLLEEAFLWTLEMIRKQFQNTMDA